MNTPRYFYYFTHIDNLKSILTHGILSRNKINKLQINFTPIHDKKVIERRKNKKFKNKPLWDYVNVYFRPINPMYHIVKKYPIVVLQITSDIIHNKNAGITDGNSASKDTRFFEDIDKGLSTLDSEQFNNNLDKRKLMAELLIYEKILPEKIITIYINKKNSYEIKNRYPMKIIKSLEEIPNLDDKWKKLDKKYKDKEAIFYNIKKSFEKIEIIEHKNFGRGFIIARHSNRITVLFKRGEKKLICNYTKSS